MSADTAPSDNLADWLEMDRAPRAQLPSEPESVAPLELDDIPAEEPWLREARVAIQATEDHGACNAVVGRLLAQRLPEEQRAQIRPILAAHRAELDRRAAAKRAPQATHGVTVAAATAAAVAAPAQVATEEPVPALVVPTAEGRPMVAGWRRIEAGLQQGTWGVCVEHLQYGVAIEPPRPGDVVLVNRARGGASQPKRIAGIVTTGAARGGYSICTVADAAPGERATAARPRAAAEPVPAHVAPEAAGADARGLSVAAGRRLAWVRGNLGADAAGLDAVIATMSPEELRAWAERLAQMGQDDALAMTRIRIRAAEEGAARAALATEAAMLATEAAAIAARTATVATVDAALAADLGSIATEATNNAGVADLGTLRADGPSSTEGRRLGVGFSTWQQYAEALRRGGLQPETRAEYIATVRRMGGQIDEATLPPANVPSALPVGAGIRYAATGPSYFDRPRAERRGFQVSKAAQELKSGAALLQIGDLIAGAVAGGAGGDFSWAGRGQITRAALLGTLAEIGRAGDAPAAKNAHAQAGRAVTTLRALGYHVHAIQGAERKSLPSHVAHRYIVGRALAGDTRTVEIGGEYGRRVLVVDLHQDDTLHCAGDADLAARVQSDFEARCAADTYISADLTTWLQRTLRNVHGATRFGVGWYVPAGQRDAAEQLTRAIAKIWGESWRHGMPVAACAHLVEGLTEGLADEITKLEEAWAGAKEEAREAQRAQVTSKKAGGLLAQIFELGERIRGYAALLGDEAVAPLRTRIAALDGEIRPLTDDTTARASMLEFS